MQYGNKLKQRSQSVWAHVYEVISFIVSIGNSRPFFGVSTGDEIPVATYSI
jgi:hypothetical protein